MIPCIWARRWAKPDYTFIDGLTRMAIVLYIAYTRILSIERILSLADTHHCIMTLVILLKYLTSESAHAARHKLFQCYHLLHIGLRSRCALCKP
jgi:hypothetical protein